MELLAVGRVGVIAVLLASAAEGRTDSLRRHGARDSGEGWKRNWG